MQAILGPRGTIVMAVAIMISTFGCNNGLILAGARVYYAMARDNLFFKRVGFVNARNVPAVALITQGIWAAFLTLPRTVTTDPRTGVVTYGNVYTQLLEYIVSADLVFYILMVGAVIVMRFKAPHLERPYRTFGYPVVPIIYIVIAAALCSGSRLPRAFHFRDWLSDRVNRHSDLFRLAQARSGNRRRLKKRGQACDDAMTP